jgi:FlaA1/EpsC-like NDP-sugar epimerase
VKIVDLARDLITLSGLRPDEDIEIRFSGVRPGEKLVEELHADAEHADKTKHPKVYIGRIKSHDWDTVSSAVDVTLDLAQGTDPELIRKALGELVPEFRAARPSRASLKATDRTTDTQEALPASPAPEITATN